MARSGLATSTFTRMRPLAASTRGGDEVDLALRDLRFLVGAAGEAADFDAVADLEADELLEVQVELHVDLIDVDEPEHRLRGGDGFTDFAHLFDEEATDRGEDDALVRRTHRRETL